jgi:hypothetical protein
LEDFLRSVFKEKSLSVFGRGGLMGGVHYKKLYNKSLASFRVKVEHKFRELKIFRILSGTYRNFRKKLHMRLNIIAGIVNLKHAF